VRAVPILTIGRGSAAPNTWTRVKVAVSPEVVVEVVVFVVEVVVASAGLNIVTTSEETNVQMVPDGIQQCCLGHL
jgi:hypothetical protein